MATAVLIDGAFFLRRYPKSYGAYGPNGHSAEKVAKDLVKMARDHLKQWDGDRRLYRIFVYDCPPLSKKAHHPITGKPIDFNKHPSAIFRQEWHRELVKRRSVALRLGYLAERLGRWVIRPKQTKHLLS